jgi:hypothetical protein
LFSTAVNFLHVNDGNYFVIIWFFKIVATITVSRKLVRMGRKFCLFVYYVELINTKLWMAEEGATLNGGLEIWTVEGRIRRRIWKECRQVFLLSWSASGDGRFYLSWLVVAIFDFHYANDYIVANNVFSIGMESIRGWCWGLMTKRKKFEL